MKQKVRSRPQELGCRSGAGADVRTRSTSARSPFAGFSLVPSCADVTGRSSVVPEPMVQVLGSHSVSYMEPINR